MGEKILPKNSGHAPGIKTSGSRLLPLSLSRDIKLIRSQCTIPDLILLYTLNTMIIVNMAFGGFVHNDTIVWWNLFRFRFLLSKWHLMKLYYPAIWKTIWVLLQIFTKATYFHQLIKFIYHLSVTSSSIFMRWFAVLHCACSYWTSSSEFHCTVYFYSKHNFAL